MFKSQQWKTTGGKTKSPFFKSLNDKYVMKVIDEKEMKMFCDIA
jgi:hypothetical protein